MGESRPQHCIESAGTSGGGKRRRDRAEELSAALGKEDPTEAALACVRHGAGNVALVGLREGRAAAGGAQQAHLALVQLGPGLGKLAVPS
jgi:hypothetical protein